MASIEELAATLRHIATPGMKPKAMRAAIREVHPDATKKDIVRAAFFALAETSSADQHAVSELHDFALAERTSGDEPEVVPSLSKRKKHRSSNESDGRQAG